MIGQTTIASDVPAIVERVVRIKIGQPLENFADIEMKDRIWLAIFCEVRESTLFVDVKRNIVRELK